MISQIICKFRCQNYHIVVLNQRHPKIRLKVVGKVTLHIMQLRPIKRCIIHEGCDRQVVRNKLEHTDTQTDIL